MNRRQFLTALLATSAAAAVAKAGPIIPEPALKGTLSGATGKPMAPFEFQEFVNKMRRAREILRAHEARYTVWVDGRPHYLLLDRQ